MMPTFCKC